MKIVRIIDQHKLPKRFLTLSGNIHETFDFEFLQFILCKIWLSITNLKSKSTLDQVIS